MMERTMSRLPLLLIVALGTAVSVRGEAPQTFSTPKGTVENVRFQQGSGGVITVTYDLVADDSRATFAVVLEVSQDGGKTFSTRAANVKGDVGSDIRPGLGKKIVWDAGKDVETLVIDQFRFNVRAVAGAGRLVEGGRIVVTTAPAGARVMIDGVERGQAPLTITLPVGTHQIGVRAPGYVDNHRAVNVRAGENDPIDFTLSSLSAAQPPVRTDGEQPPPRKGGSRLNPLRWPGAVVGKIAGKGGPTVAEKEKEKAEEEEEEDAECTFLVQPTDVVFGAEGGSQDVSVTVSPARCEEPAWKATAKQGGWVTILAPSPSTGSGTVVVQVPPNPNAAGRSQTLKVAGQQVVVAQSGRK
jgi:hypothetical protein